MFVDIILQLLYCAGIMTDVMESDVGVEQALRDQWPEHASLIKPWKASNLDNYYPGVARAMRAQGMVSLKQLMARIEWVLAQPGMGTFFGGIHPHEVNVHAIISPSNKQSAKYVYSVRADDYKKAARLVAMALGEDEEAVFGPLSKWRKLRGKFNGAVHLPPDAWHRLECPDDNLPEAAAIEMEKAEAIELVLQDLDVRHQEIMSMRFGLRGWGRARTLQEVGDEFGLTGARVEQIEKRALEKLSHPANARALAAFGPACLQDLSALELSEELAALHARL